MPAASAAMERLAVGRGKILQFLQGLQRGGGIFVQEQVGPAVVSAAHALQGPAQEGQQ